MLGSQYDEEFYVKEYFNTSLGWTNSGIFKSENEAIAAAYKEMSDWEGHVHGVRIYKKTRTCIFEKIINSRENEKSL